MSKNRILALITVLSMCSTFTLPAYAEEADTSVDSTVSVSENEDDISTDTDYDSSVLSDNEAEPEEPETMQESEDDISDNEAPCRFGAEDDISGDEQYDKAETVESDGLISDEAEYLADDWFEWDATNGVLTLKGQLPDTNQRGYSTNERTYYANIAFKANYIDPWKVKKVVISSGTKAGTSAETMFGDFRNLQEIIGLENLDTSNVTNMAGMFYYCCSLSSLDLTEFDTSNVTNMGQMFGHCSSLSSLDLTEFDTSNVTNMSAMFGGCVSLNTITVLYSKWKTSNVKYFSDMFSGCSSLVGGDGTSVTYFWSGFPYKTYARIDHGSIGEKGFLTAKPENVSGEWFEWNGEDHILTLKNQLPDTFYDGQNEYDANKDDTIYNLAYLAGIDKYDIKKIHIKSNTKAGTNASYMFWYMKGLQEIQGLSNLDTSTVTSMHYMFNGCNHLTSLDLSSFDTSRVTNMHYMFCGCYNLSSLDLSSFDTSKVKDMGYMFSHCQNLSSVNLSSFDTSKVTTMRSMFQLCNQLTTLDLSSFNTLYVTDMRDMFNMYDQYSYTVTSNLKTILVSKKWVTYAVSDFNSSGMFNYCIMLQGGSGTTYNDENRYADKKYARIDKGPTQPGFFTEKIIPPSKPTVVINTAFGGRTVQLNCDDTDAEIYYNFGSSAITTSCKHVKAGETIFLNEPMTGSNAAMYFKAYNGKWSPLGKWGVLNVQIAKPLIVQSGKKSDNNFKVYTQTKDSYIVYTLDGSTPEINEGTNRPTVKNGRLVWSTSTVINVPKGKTIKAIAVRCGLVTSDVMTYTNS